MLDFPDGLSETFSHLCNKPSLVSPKKWIVIHSYFSHDTVSKNLTRPDQTGRMTKTYLRVANKYRDDKEV